MSRSSNWKLKVPWLRLIGLLLLGLLFWKLDIQGLGRVLQGTNWHLLLVAVTLNLPMVFLKSLRWQQLMRTQEIIYPIGKAYLAYWGSIFVGFLTPGRLGEFVKALYISRDCNVPVGRGLASALVDRLFDLYALLVVGAIALASLSSGHTILVVLLLVVGTLLLAFPLALIMNDDLFALIGMWGSRQEWLKRMFESGSWLFELRVGLKKLSPYSLVVAMGMTIMAYGIFFGQCYFLSLAVGLSVKFFQVSYAVALGSLVTLLPISVSGIGTREAAIVTYLGTIGVPEEKALSFSLLVFSVFYIAGGLMGAVAWLLTPVSIRHILQRANSRLDSGHQAS